MTIISGTTTYQISEGDRDAILDCAETHWAEALEQFDCSSDNGWKNALTFVVDMLNIAFIGWTTDLLSELAVQAAPEEALAD